LEQKISVFEKTEHAQVHANAGDQPTLPGSAFLSFAYLAPEPEIHRRCGKKQRGKGRIPRAVENVAGDHEQVFSQLPPAETPVERNDDYIENDEGKRIKKHDGKLGLPLPTAADHLRQHIEANVLSVV
jgi:hypothetical protein